MRFIALILQRSATHLAMANLESALVVVHVLADLAWIGGILAAAQVAVDSTADAKTAGKLALGVYRRIAAPGFGVAFLAGGIRLMLSTGYYFKSTKFMHAKLLLALGIVAIHHVIGARIKRQAAGQEVAPGPTKTLALVIAGLSVGVVGLAVLKPF